MKELLMMMAKLMKQGRGFNFQSHGIMNGHDFFNFALYPLDKNKGHYYYFHHEDPLVIVEKLKEHMLTDDQAKEILANRDSKIVEVEPEHDPDLDDL